MKTPTQQISFLALICKDLENMEDLSYWRPISLINCDWKIITKAYANRLKDILHTIIEPDHTYGIPGRSIRNNLWLTRDILNYGLETTIPGVIVSVDQEKAFDRVDHKYLLKVMERFGFGPGFMNMANIILTDNVTHVISVYA